MSTLSIDDLKLIKADYANEVRHNLTLWCTEALAPQGLRPARHHRLLITKLKQVVSGQIDRLMVFMPPGSAKSTYSSILFPPYWYVHHEHSNVIACSHTGELADKFGRAVRNVVDEHSDTLGYQLNADNRAAGRWETSQGGEYYAAGVLGNITGRRADLGIIDDPVKSADEAVRDTVREKVWDWYQADFYTRLKPTARIILIMTRWHEDDLGGRLLANQATGGDKWEVLSLPALALANDAMGRSVNEALWPEWESADKLARKRAAVGERVWSALFQQDPRPPADEAFFQLKYLLNDTGVLDANGAPVRVPVQFPALCDAVFFTLDTAVKTGKKNDGTAGIYWALNKNVPNGSQHKLTMLDYEILKIEGSMLEAWMPTVFQNLERYAKLCGARFGSVGAFIEDKASGTILIQQGKRRNWPVHAIDSKLTAMGKSERAISVSGYVSPGMVKMSDHAYNKVVTYNGRSCNHLIDQITLFRLDVKDQADDALDAFTYGVAIALGNAGGF